MILRFLAIDPGSTESGYVVIDENYKVLEKDKIHNEDLVNWILEGHFNQDCCIIEMVASYGMAVGQTVFDTCVWIGRFRQAAIFSGGGQVSLFRKDVKMNLCGQTRAKDSNITQALVDRFSFPRHAEKGGKGTKADPGFFFGFKSDIWQAYALGVTFLDNKTKGE